MPQKLAIPKYVDFKLLMDLCQFTRNFFDKLSLNLASCQMAESIVFSTLKETKLKKDRDLFVWIFVNVWIQRVNS